MSCENLDLELAARDLLRVGPTELALYGDSRIADSHSVSATGVILPAQGLANWIQAIGGGRYRCPADLNFGVGGDTVGMALARISAVVNCRAREVIVVLGTNNSAASIAPATTLADYQSLLSQLTQAGKHVTLVAEYPRGATAVGGTAAGTGSVTAGFGQGRLSGTPLAYHGQLRRWLMDVASQMRGVDVIDVWPLLAAPGSATGDFINPGVTRDSLHLAPIGAQLVAAEIVARLNPRYPTLQTFGEVNNAFPFSAANNPRGCLLLNPSMTGTTGTLTGTNAGSGTVAQHWVGQAISLTGLTGSVSWSKATGSVGPLAGAALQQVTVSGSLDATANPQLYCRSDIPVANLAAGDVVQSSLWAEVDAGQTGVGAVGLYIQLNDATQTYVYHAQSRLTASAAGVSGATYPLPDAAFAGERALLHIAPRFVVPSGLTLCRFGLSVRLNEGQTVALTARFGRCAMNKLPA
jgi:lysophospholipase L1-like esterase